MPSKEWVMFLQTNGTTELSNLVNKGTVNLEGGLLSSTSDTGSVVFAAKGYSYKKSSTTYTCNYNNESLSDLDIKSIDKIVILFTGQGSSSSSYIRCRANATSSTTGSSGAWVKKTMSTSSANYTVEFSDLSLVKSSRYFFDFNIVAGAGYGTLKISNVRLKITYTLNTYTITANSNDDSMGTASGTASGKTKGQTVTITASPNPGYRFVKWSDGDTSLSKTITVEGNATYTATFEPIRVTSLEISHSELNMKISDNVELVQDYISTLNLKGLGCGTPNCVSEIKPNYLMLRSTANDAYVGSYGMSSPISDTAKMYVFDIDPNSKYTYIVNAKVPEGAQYSIFVFYYDSNYNYIYHDAQTNKTLGQTIINDSNPWSKQIPANAKYASIRVDNDIAGHEIYYTNILVYKGDLDSIYNSAAIAEIIKPDDARNKVVMWSSSDPDVVTINEDTGVLTAKSSGTAVITCQSRDGSFTAYCTVNVTSEGTTNIYLGDIPITSVYLGNLPLTPYLGSRLL